MLTKRARLIWEGLVRYANSEQGDLEDLRKTVSRCMPWAARLSVLGFADFVLNNSEAFAKQAAEYRPPIRDIVAALCGEPRRLPAEASAFLMDHGGHVRISFDEAPFDPDDEEHFEESNRVWQLSGEPKKRPLGIYTRSKNYQDLADPICDFILNELERITEDDGQVPICACEGPNCNKFIMPERIGKGRFCSDACKSAYYRRKNSPSASNDYQWLYRCYTLVHPDKPKAEWNVGLLRRKLAKNKANFERIQSEHKDVARIRKLIAKLEPYTR
jgi:hypothetical protein